MLFFSAEERPDCSRARCEVQFSPRCPEDSILIEGYAPPGECCPLPSRCVCSPAGCLRKVCQPGHLNILVSKSSGKPGECCDLYECKPGKEIQYLVKCCDVLDSIFTPFDLPVNINQTSTNQSPLAWFNGMFQPKNGNPIPHVHFWHFWSLSLFGRNCVKILRREQQTICIFGMIWGWGYDDKIFICGRLSLYNGLSNTVYKKTCRVNFSCNMKFFSC